MRLTAGTRLGPYEILRALGAGGMGEVYRAKDTRLDREVAVKVMPELLARDAEMRSRFEREAKAIAALSHPNIVAIYDVGAEGDVSYVVMELLEGETLRARLNRSAITWEKSVEIASAVADGLAAGHAKGIVHRDIKPDNLFITIDGQVKILDFGLARMETLDPTADAGTTPTVTLDTRRGSVLGTAAYMSPEQVRGEPVDARSDIFSLGCVIYELSVGERAFSRETAVETMTAVLKEEPTALAAPDKSKMHAGLGRIVARCLEKKPEQRFQSASDLAFQLRHLHLDSGVSAAQHGRRLVFWQPATFLILATVAIGSAAAIYLGRGGKPKSAVETGAIRSLAVLPFENAGDDAEVQYLCDEIPASIIDRLVSLESLRVVPRSTAFRYDVGDQDTGRIGRGLNANVVLTGQINVRGDTLRVRTELIDVAEGRQLWSERYDRTMDDILSIEDDISDSIAEALEVQITGAQRSKIERRYTDNPEAYAAYLRARFWFAKRTDDGSDRAITAYDEAIALDPEFALAYAGKAETLVIQALTSRESGEVIPRAREAAERAVSLDPLLAEAHTAMGAVQHFYDWDYDDAERSFLRAIELNPQLATPHQYYGHLISARDPEKAIAVHETAVRLDPGSLIYNTCLGHTYAWAGKADKALEQLQRTLEMDPSYPAARSYLGRLLAAQGAFEEAIETLEATQEAVSISLTSGDLGWAYGVAGREVEAREELRKLLERSKTEYVPAQVIANVYAGLGDKKNALDWLEKACEQREAWLTLIEREPHFHGLRGDPRFEAIVQRIGLNPDAKSASSVRDESRKTMLAVLPFQNLSNDPEQEYFSDGMTEEMITHLGRMRPALLGVIARTSAMRYKKTDKAIDQIGRELSVTYVLEGGVRRSGNTVRISAQLIQVSDQTQIWSDSYTRDLSDVFAIQAEVAEAVAKALAVELLPTSASARAIAPTTSNAAYNEYLLGRHYWAQRDPESLYAAIDHFKRAIEIDPSYALAYSGLADGWSVLPYYVPGPYNEMHARAKEAAERALALDESSAEAHFSMALVLENEYDIGAAAEYYRKAVELDPNNATAHYCYGWALCVLDHVNDGIAEFQRAISLDPLYPPARWVFGGTLNSLRRYEEAGEQLRKAIELKPGYLVAHRDLIWSCVGQERMDDAAAVFEKYLGLLGQPDEAVRGFRRACSESGLPAAIRNWLASIPIDAETPLLSMGDRAGWHAWSGETDIAFDLLNRALEHADPALNDIQFHPAFDKLRDDPRFDALLRKAGIPKMELPRPSTTR